MACLSRVKSAGIFYRLSTVFLLIFAGTFRLFPEGYRRNKYGNYVESLGSGDNPFLRTLNIIFSGALVVRCHKQGSILPLLIYLVATSYFWCLYFLGKALYQKGLYTAASLGSSKKAQIKSKDIVEQSQLKASLKKEIRVILRTKAFSGNCAYINIIWPVGIFMLFHFTKDKGFMADFIQMYQSGKDRAEMILVVSVIAIAFIATALNSLASTAFTREGQHLSLIKFIPVPYGTQIMLKHL